LGFFSDLHLIKVINLTSPDGVSSLDRLGLQTSPLETQLPKAISSGARAWHSISFKRPSSFRLTVPSLTLIALRLLTPAFGPLLKPLPTTFRLIFLLYLIGNLSQIPTRK